MPEKERIVACGVAHHIGQRGAGRQTVIYTQPDRQAVFAGRPLGSAGFVACWRGAAIACHSGSRTTCLPACWSPGALRNRRPRDHDAPGKPHPGRAVFAGACPPRRARPFAHMMER